jgi:hypothetical protein
VGNLNPPSKNSKKKIATNQMATALPIVFKTLTIGIFDNLTIFSKVHKKFTRIKNVEILPLVPLCVIVARKNDKLRFLIILVKTITKQNINYKHL